MHDAVDVGGEEFISSKRAAELSGYAQDYIGQLARKGLIQAKRIGGLWYVSQKSLSDHKTHADSYQPTAPHAQPVSGDEGSIISFDGRDYVSAARAARLTGYNADYVGQLSRTGKILSRQIGNRWYVDREAIIAHKNEKDAMLGAVQAASVGIATRKDERPLPRLSSEPFFQYRTEGRDLIPKPNNQRAGFKNLYDQYRDAEYPIAIRKLPDRIGKYEARPAIIHIENETEESKTLIETPHGAKKERKGPNTVILLLAGIIIVSIAALIFLGNSPQGDPSGNSDAMERGANWVKKLFQNEVTYKRAQ